jgi:hypothetical protein
MKMRRLNGRLAAFILAGFLVTGLVTNAEGQRRNDRLIRDTTRSLSAKADDFSVNMGYALRSNSVDRRVQQDAEMSVESLKSAVRNFSDNVDQRRENRDDMEQIVTAAQDVNGFLRSNPQGPRIASAWNDLRETIDRLASNYGITPDWQGRISNASRPDRRDDDYTFGNSDNSGNSNDTFGGSTAVSDSDLTGTYSIDRARSERAADIIAGVRVSGAQRQDLQKKLEAPEQIAISVNRDQVTLASSNGSPITFPADGRERTENVDGRTLRVKATLDGDELTVASLGGETDYTVVFSTVYGGPGVKVTRRITTEYLK